MAASMRALEADFRAQGMTLFTCCELYRRYTPRELAAADYLLISPYPFFMPSGEECGTLYDDTAACAHCGAGARQLNELHLELESIPRREVSDDFAGLSAKYLEVVGRPTGSSDRGYLIWKIREAEKGRIPVGPRQARRSEGEARGRCQTTSGEGELG